MSTARRHCELGDSGHSPQWLNDPFWSRLNRVQNSNLRIQSEHSARCMDFDAVWRRYCEVIRELEMTAAELEALRNGRE